MSEPPAYEPLAVEPESAESIASRATPVVFEADGFRVVRPLRASRLYRYEEITHLAGSRRGFAIATRTDVVLLRRGAFREPGASQALDTALRRRIARLPGGGLQLGRMAEIDQLARRPRRAPTVHAFAALCLLAFGLQFRDPFVGQVGSFIPGLTMQGELWRLWTANFLHDQLLFPMHIGLNLLCVLVLGIMVERVLGSWRMVIVMGASGIGAMLACGLADYAEVIGASGVAAGLAGALLCIELQGSRRLPAWWRIPRRLFIGALLVQATLDWLVPAIAAAAHLGGFMAGYFVTRILLADALMRRPVAGATWGAAMATLLAMLVSAWAASPLVMRNGDALESHGLKLLHTPGGSITHDNDVAWLMVTESEPTGVGLHVAAALAERAVDRTARTNPDLLDTLAEVLFAAGDVYGALEVIDEAISVSRGERYFEEQRRRFTGERSAEDRPEPPGLPWYLRERGFGLPDEEPAYDPEAPQVSI